VNRRRLSNCRRGFDLGAPPKLILLGWGSSRVACIFYQTNDGNFKVIHGSYTYLPEKPEKNLN
jgi:hypothetical protein